LHEREDNDEREDPHDMDLAGWMFAAGLFVHGALTGSCRPPKFVQADGHSRFEVSSWVV
jgi:hypothetical protein